MWNPPWSHDPPPRASHRSVCPVSAACWDWATSCSRLRQQLMLTLASLLQLLTLPLRLLALASLLWLTRTCRRPPPLIGPNVRYVLSLCPLAGLSSRPYPYSMCWWRRWRWLRQHAPSGVGRRVISTHTRTHTRVHTHAYTQCLY